MRVLVCGGRDYVESRRMAEVLKEHKIDVLIHGAARGADKLANDYAVEHYIPLLVFPARWEVFGPPAGAIRNHEMLIHGKPDLVIAFPGGPGTAHMVSIAKKAGVPVLLVDQ